MRMNAHELQNKKVFCEDLEVGKVLGQIVDTTSWKVTHLDVGLTKDAAYKIHGARNRGVRNILNVSAISDDEDAISDDGIRLSCAKGNLPQFLHAPKDEDRYGLIQTHRPSTDLTKKDTEAQPESDEQADDSSEQQEEKTV